jgi:hypothetical protein
MSSPRFALVAIGLLAAAASAWTPRISATAQVVGHCATSSHQARPTRTAHAPSVPHASSQEPHECSHCPAGPCSTLDHCTVAAPIAAALGAGFLAAPTSIAAPALWVSDRPLSANPTPPIPPPQPIL